jgi:hypothetical protein
MRFLVPLFAAALTIFVNLLAQAAENRCDVEKLNPSLSIFHGLQRLPDLVSSSPSNIQPSKRALPQNLLAAFDEFQTALFGKTGVIKLLACDGCEAVANADTMAVYLDPAFLDKLRERHPSDSEQLELFLIAHEISHFTLDYQTLMSETGLSQCGNIPLMHKGMMDFVDKNIENMSAEAQTQQIGKYMSLASASHAEVDALGVLTGKKLGLNLVPAAKALLNDTLMEVSRSNMEGAEFIKADILKRLEMLDRSFPSN